ncbi:MAG: hypothetical protein SOW46_13610 [Candidatus Aphodomonas sp.]|nr:hypothetical protein [Candidatus Aphodomonas sp.]
MRFAVLTEDQKFVENVIVGRADQKEELEAALGRTLMDAAPLGLEIGDLKNGEAWTRNIDGEQVQLPIGDNPAVAEAIAILEGVDAE